VIVAVSTDEFNALKGKKALVPYEERREIIEGLKCVDLVIPEYSWEQKAEDVVCHDVSCLIMGDDWKNHFDYLRKLCDVIYLPRTPSVSSSKLRSVFRY